LNTHFTTGILGATSHIACTVKLPY